MNWQLGVILVVVLVVILMVVRRRRTPPGPGACSSKAWAIAPRS